MSKAVDVLIHKTNEFGTTEASIVIYNKKDEFIRYLGSVVYNKTKTIDITSTENSIIYLYANLNLIGVNVYIGVESIYSLPFHLMADPKTTKNVIREFLVNLEHSKSFDTKLKEDITSELELKLFGLI